MDRPALTVYLLLLSLTALTTFAILPAPLSVVYLLFGLLYLFPLGTELYRARSRAYHLLVLSCSSALSLLFVVDPYEYGFFGYDPYLYTLPSYVSFGQVGALAEFVSRTNSWPSFYAFTSVLQVLSGVPIEPLGKYVPLVMAVTPALVYLTVSRLTDPSVGFLTGVGFASTRTLLLFESKFVDEILAVLLLFGLFLVLTVAQDRRRALLAFPLLTTILLTHHAITFLTALLLGLWWLGDRLATGTRTPDRLRAVPGPAAPPSLWYAVGFAVGGVTVFLYIGFDLVGGLLTTVIFSPFSAGVPAGVGAGVSGGGELPFRGLVTAAALPVFVVLAAISAFGVLTRRFRFPDWAVSWTGFAGVVAVMYAAILVLGRLVPLDPIRFLIVLTPTLLAPALVAIARLSDTGLTRGGTRWVAGVLVALLVITQLAAVSPHVLVSDPNETTLQEGHYTPAQFEASAWAGSHVTRTLTVYETGLWAASGFTDTALAYNPFVEGSTCQDLRVWRTEADESWTPDASVLYASNDIHITSCS